MVIAFANVNQWFKQPLSVWTHFSFTPPPTPDPLPWIINVASSNVQELAAKTADVKESIGIATLFSSFMLNTEKNEWALSLRNVDVSSKNSLEKYAAWSYVVRLRLACESLAPTTNDDFWLSAKNTAMDKYKQDVKPNFTVWLSSTELHQDVVSFELLSGYRKCISTSIGM